MNCMAQWISDQKSRSTASHGCLIHNGSNPIHNGWCQWVLTQGSEMAISFNLGKLSPLPPESDMVMATKVALQQRHNEHGSISNHQCLDCLLNCLFKPRSKKTSKFHITGLCEGNSPIKGPVTRKTFPPHDVIMGMLSWLPFGQHAVCRFQ